MPIVNIHAAKTQLSRLLDCVASGEEVIIARAGRPVARLQPIEQTDGGKRQLGRSNGRFELDGFDEDLPKEVMDAFEGR